MKFLTRLLASDLKEMKPADYLESKGCTGIQIIFNELKLEFPLSKNYSGRQSFAIYSYKTKTNRNRLIAFTKFRSMDVGRKEDWIHEAYIFKYTNEKLHDKEMIKDAIRRAHEHEESIFDFPVQ